MSEATPIMPPDEDRWGCVVPLIKFRELSAKAALFDELTATIETLLEYVPEQCDQDNPHVKVWCCTHNQKRCNGEADVAKARAVLAKVKEKS